MHSSTIRFGAGLILLGALAAPSASAQVRRAGGGYLFRLKLTNGQVVRYDAVVSQAVPGTSGKGLSVTLPFVQSVDRVRNGVATLTLKMGPPVLNGQPIEDRAHVTHIQVDSRGQITGGANGGTTGITIFPTNPVRPGATWNAAVPLPALGGGTAPSASAVYRFVRMTSYHGKPAAELAVRVTSNRGGQISGSGTTYISAADGAMLVSTLRIDFTAPQLGNKPMHLSAVITRRG